MALPSHVVAGGTGWAVATLGTGLSKPATWTGCRKERLGSAFWEGGSGDPGVAMQDQLPLSYAYRPHSVSPSILGDRGRPP